MIGGGIYCKDSSPTISNNVIKNNSADNRGGGISTVGSSSNSSLTITNNIIAGNSVHSSYGGGGIHFSSSISTTSQNTIVNNSTDDHGGGICVSGGGSILVSNSIIWANKSKGEGDQISGHNSWISIIYSDVQGGWDDVGNIDADPFFVDPENGNYHLKPDSPCIDAGSPGPQHNDPDGTRNDMGAYGGPNAVILETQPVINEVSPDHGPIAGGREVTITGENFIDGATVKFGENEAYDITFVSDTEITASTPATEEVATVNVTVTNPNGESGVLRDAFTYEAKTSGSFTITLNKGLNMVSLPNCPDTPYTAKTFAEKIGDVTLILHYDSANQEFVPYIPEHLTATDFPIKGGEGYIINVLEDKQISFTGTVWDNTAAPKRSLRSGRPPRSAVGHGIWAFVVAGKLPVELCNSGDLTVSVSSVNRNLYKELPLSHSKFSVAFVNSDQSAVVEPGEQFEITVKDIDGRLVAEQQIRVNTKDLAKAFVITNPRYNPIPKNSALLQNYPNPFNPETWIPFQLAERSDVTISIYDISGKLVRRLKLGEKHAGIYTTKGKTVYWDGRNSLGERVSSGVYFYTIHAGSFRTTLRMAVVK